MCWNVWIKAWIERDGMYREEDIVESMFQ
jgi:hypothetical protein